MFVDETGGVGAVRSALKYSRPKSVMRPLSWILLFAAVALTALPAHAEISQQHRTASHFTSQRTIPPRLEAAHPGLLSRATRLAAAGSAGAAPPAPACEAELAKLCPGLNGTGYGCKACTEAGGAELEKHGCKASDNNRYCKSPPPVCPVDLKHMANTVSLQRTSFIFGSFVGYNHCRLSFSALPLCRRGGCPLRQQEQWVTNITTTRLRWPKPFLWRTCAAASRSGFLLATTFLTAHWLPVVACLSLAAAAAAAPQLMAPEL